MSIFLYDIRKYNAFVDSKNIVIRPLLFTLSLSSENCSLYLMIDLYLSDRFIVWLFIYD